MASGWAGPIGQAVGSSAELQSPGQKKIWPGVRVQHPHGHGAPQMAVFGRATSRQVLPGTRQGPCGHWVLEWRVRGIVCGSLGEVAETRGHVEAMSSHGSRTILADHSRGHDRTVRPLRARMACGVQGPKPVPRCMNGTVRNRCVHQGRVCGMFCGCRSLSGVWSDLSGQVAETQGHDEAMTGSSAVPDYHMARQP